MSDTLTPWRKMFDYRFLSGEDLMNKDWTLTIKAVKREQVYSQQKKSNEDQLAIWFTQGEKGMIVNKTNAKVISKVTGTPYIEQWVGKTITIRAERVKAFGEITMAVRVVDPSREKARADMNS